MIKYIIIIIFLFFSFNSFVFTKEVSYSFEYISKDWEIKLDKIKEIVIQDIKNVFDDDMERRKIERVVPQYWALDLNKDGRNELIVLVNSYLGGGGYAGNVTIFGNSLNPQKIYSEIGREFKIRLLSWGNNYCVLIASRNWAGESSISSLMCHKDGKFRRILKYVSGIYTFQIGTEMDTFLDDTYLNKNIIYIYTKSVQNIKDIKKTKIAFSRKKYLWNSYENTFVFKFEEKLSLQDIEKLKSDQKKSDMKYLFMDE